MRLVLVDPSRTVRRIVTNLVQQWQYEVSAFGDGAEALAYIQQDDSAQVLLTSAELPSLSGLELCVRARAFSGTRRPLYIIMMSSTDEYTKCIEALDKGVDDFISKPPIAEELRARLRTAHRVTAMQSELVRLATTDFLTGLANRRAFFENANKVMERAKNGAPTSVMMIDLDHFKKINDVHGHSVGDEVLKRVAAEIATLPGVAARLGGEEFVVLAEGPISDLADLAQDFRRSVQGFQIFAGERTVDLTCSLGLAEWEADDTLDTLLRRADVALYEAKRTGRNKVVLADSFVLSAQHQEWQGAARLRNRASKSVVLIRAR